MVKLQCEADLFEVIAAVRPPPSLASSLHRRQEYRDENSDNRDYREQLNERKASITQSLRTLFRQSHWDIPLKQSTACRFCWPKIRPFAPGNDPRWTRLYR
jgi:hypothetical protein